MKRFFLLLIIFSNIIIPANQLNVSVASFQPINFNSTALYSLNYEFVNRSKTSIGMGLAASQIYESTNKITTITLPNIFIKQYFKLSQVPFTLYLGAGFSINHVDSSYGSNFIGTQLMSGFHYALNRLSHLIVEYNYQYAQTVSSTNERISFDGPVFKIGIGQKFNHPRPIKHQNTATSNAPKPKYLKRNDNQSTRSPSQSRQQKQTYDKTKKMMNELSWPTY